MSDLETPPEVGIVWVDGKIRVLTKATSKSSVLGVLACAIHHIDPQTGELVLAVMQARLEALRELRNKVAH